MILSSGYLGAVSFRRGLGAFPTSRMGPMTVYWLLLAVLYAHPRCHRVGTIFAYRRNHFSLEVNSRQRKLFLLFQPHSITVSVSVKRLCKHG